MDAQQPSGMSTSVRSEWEVQVERDGVSWLARARPLWFAVGSRPALAVADDGYVELGTVDGTTDLEALVSAEAALRSMRITMKRPKLGRDQVLDQLTYWATFAADRAWFNQPHATQAEAVQNGLRAALERLEAHGLISFCDEDRLLAVADNGFLSAPPAAGEIRYEELVVNTPWFAPDGSAWTLHRVGARAHSHAFTAPAPDGAPGFLERHATLQQMNMDGWRRA